IYRRRAMGARWMALEAAADFPGLWAAAAAAALWAMAPQTGAVVVAAAAIFWAFRLRMLIFGGGDALRAPQLTIFLYLCAAEALPVVLLFA
ncbi:MAG: hypothetical protein RMM53_12710, partial [Bacteroidia bacterium]|nr:hypothetical protein [Bacteroidia bacterium]